MARRICTIVSNLETRNNRLTELQEILIERKYPRTLIDNGIARAKAIDIQELRRPKDTLDTVNVLPYVSTHNPRNAEAYNIIHQNMPLLQKDQRMKRALQTQKIIKSKRQSKSLKKLLTSAKLPTENTTPTVKKCGRPNCGICINLIEGRTYEFKSGHIFSVRNHFTCASENLIYVLKCNGCNEDYIGQTGLTLRKRMTVHRQQIRDPNTRQIPVSEHLDLCASNKFPKYHIFPLYQCADNISDQIRMNKESMFIKKYKPRLNIL